MHQVISRYSVSNINLFLILPPEVLSIILERISSDCISNAKLLSLSKDMRDYVLISVKYVSRLETSQISMIRFFTGITSLIFRKSDYTTESYLISKNTLSNLVYMVIPVGMISHLNGCLTNLRYLETIPDTNLFGNEIIKLDSKLMPCLRMISMDEHWIDIGDIQTLEILEVSNCEVDVNILNKLNISELSLSYVCTYSVMFDIPSLRKLSIHDSYFDLSRLSKLNISELILIDMKDVENNARILNIPSLETLIFDVYTCDIDLSNLSRLRTLSMPSYIVEYYRVSELTTLNIIRSSKPIGKLVKTINIHQIMVNFSKLEHLCIQDRFCKIDGIIPDSLIVTQV